MKNLKFIGLAIFILFIFSYSNAHATINWTPLPQACLPERAVKWDNRFNNADQQAACHCPPKSYCPTTYEEFSDNSKAKMPMGFVMRCCEPVNAPERCPNGELKVAGKACVEPVTAQCPAKFYPNLLESGIVDENPVTTPWGTHISNKFIGSDKIVYDFDEGGMLAYRLSKQFGWSLRSMSFSSGSLLGLSWVNGDDWCKTEYFSGVCASDGYREFGNHLTEENLLFTIIRDLSPDTLTWFGISVAQHSKLPNNKAKENIVNEYSKQSLSFVQVQDAGLRWRLTRPSRTFEEPKIGFESSHPEFLAACRSVAGEYVTLEYHNQVVNGETLSCPYLQCRYVYDTSSESCLSSDTQITLANGTKSKIADLKVGDLLIGEDGKPSKVKAVNKYQSELRVLYGINGGKAMITGDHPIKTKEGWKVITDEAAKLYATELGFAKEPLKKGDKIITLDGEIEVKSIERHPNFEPVDTYNLKVEGNNSFTANDMIVKGFNKMEIKY